jgi:hypothetical protein
MDRTVALSLMGLSLAAGLGAGWLLSSAKGGGPEADGRAASLEREVKDLRQRLAESTRKEATLEAAPVAPAKPATAPPPVPPPAAPGTSAMDAEAAAAAEAARVAKANEPRFVPAGSEAALKAVDWSVVGKNMAEMALLITKFANELATTGKFTPDTIGRVQQLNGPLVTAALKAAEKMGVTNPNVAFTHPAFMANAMAAALEAAGKPLSEAQAQAIGAAAEEYTAKEARRVASYGPDTFALDKAIEESALRDEFFARAFAQMTAEQREVLQPAATRGRLQADLFSPGLVWLTRSQVLSFRTKDGLIADLEQQVMRRTRLPDDRKTAVHDAVVEWANAIPAAELETPGDALSLAGMVPVAAVVTAATRESALLKRLIDVARPDDATAARIRAVEAVLVPVRQAAE